MGDKNFGYFHAIASGRRNVNKFSMPEDKEGLLVFDEEKIVQIITKYFQDIFITTSSRCKETVAQAINPCISHEMNERLIAELSDEEIKTALFSIHPDKAPGPYGFSASSTVSYSFLVNGAAQGNVQPQRCIRQETLCPHSFSSFVVKFSLDYVGELRQKVNSLAFVSLSEVLE